MDYSISYGFLEKDGTPGIKLLIDMSNVPSDDPLAYVHGFTEACDGRVAVNQGGQTTVAAYTKGRAHGESVYKGSEPMPLWAKVGGGEDV